MKRYLAVAVAVLALGACDDSDPAGPDGGDEVGSLTVNAAAGWAYVDLDGDEASVVAVADPTTSTAWDIAFNATSVMLNGGAAGPGGVTGYCICQNADAADAAVMAMTTASELADFEAVTSEDIPAGDWVSDALSPAIDAWYSYNPSTHVISPAPGNVYAVRTASGDAFAKLHVIDIAGATQANAGDVTIEYAYQPAAGEPFEAPDTVVLNAAAGERLVLETGAVVTSGDWDLMVTGWEIRLNAGASGSGSAGAYLTGETFDDLADAGEAPAGAYSVDSFAGVFEASPWYRYNLTGTDHQIWPTFDVYLVDTADGVYKVQLTSYYSATGDSRHISFRYELLD